MSARAAAALLAALLSACAGADPQAAVPEARQLLDAGRTGEARILLKKALQDGAPPAEARVLLARIALAEGNPAAAAAELSAVQGDALDTPEAVALRVRVAVAQGRADEAATLLETRGASIAEPERSLLGARVLGARGEGAEAIAVLRAARERFPDSEPLLVEQVETLARLGNLAAAVEAVDAWLAAKPVQLADAHRLRGELNLRRGAARDAAQDLRAALAEAPKAWPAPSLIATQAMLGEALLSLGDVGGAREQLAALQQSWPGAGATALLAAEVDLASGRAGEAADRLARLVEAMPGNDRLETLLADALLRSGNLIRAEEVLNRRLAADPGATGTRRALAALYLQQGRPDRVVALYEDAQPGSVAPDAGGELLQAARSARARASAIVAELTRALAARPDDAGLRARLAAAQVASGEALGALSTLGPLPRSGFTPDGAAARMSALLALRNEIEANRLVDALLDAGSGAANDVLLATADAAQRARHASAVSRLLDAAARREPASAEVALRRASVAFDERRFEDAERLLSEIPAQDPATHAALLARARVAESLGRPEDARRLLDEAIRAQPDDTQAPLLLAGVALRAGDDAGANKVLDAFATDAERAAAAGRLLTQLGRGEAARARFRQAVDREAGNAGYWHELGESELALGDRKAARESFERAVRLRGDAIDSALTAVQLALQQNDRPAARRVADAVRRALPGTLVADLLDGQVALAEGRGAAAEKVLQRAYVQRPSAATAVGLFRARLLAGQARPEQPLLTWLAREPRDLATRRLLATHYSARGQRAQAQEQLEHILSQAPADAPALNNLAWEIRKSDSVRAEKLARQAFAIAPANASIADTLGTILTLRGVHAEAVKVLKPFAEAKPADAALRYHYAAALAGAGERRAARDVLAAVLRDGGAFDGRAEAQRLFEEL